MPISTTCPQCGKKIKIADHLAGRSLKCPKCRAALGPVEVPTQRELSSPDSATVAPPPMVGQSPPTEEGSGILSPPQGPGEIGRLGGYRVTRVLGEGGMGVVFQAEDVALRRTVALKAMKPSVAAGGEASQRFLREARAAAAIEHDHVVSIYQVGEDRGVPFLAMQFLRGEALDSRLRRQPVLPLAEVLRIGREVAEGLAAAHQRGLIHRDIKPANIWLEGAPAVGQIFLSAGGMADKNVCPTTGGRVKIVDFGLARSSGQEETQLTKLGAIIGTPAFMSPEQGRGVPLDHRSDLFSLGCVLYRMSTGAMAFQAADIIATLMAVATEQPKSPRELNPDLPKELSDLILQLLAKDPAHRPQSARKVIEAIEDIETKTRPVPRRPWKRAAALIAVLVVCVGGVSFLTAWKLFHRPATDDKPLSPLAKGELVLETTLPMVRVLVKQNGQEVKALTRASPRASIDGGSYDLELAQAPPGLTLSTAAIQLSPGGRETLRLREEPASAIALVPRPAPLDGVRNWTLETIAHRGPIYRMVYHPRRRLLASVGNDGTIRIWDVVKGQLERVLVGHHSAVVALAWSPDGNLLASAGCSGVPTFNRPMPPAIGATQEAETADLTVRIWEPATGRLVHVFTGHKNTVRSLAWSPDSSTVVSAGQDKILHFWDVKKRKPARAPVDGHKDWFHAVAWSPDGKWLATDRHSEIDIRDAESGTVVRTLRGHTSWIFTLAWSPDSKVLASGSEDRTVRLWDADAEKCLHTLNELDAPVWSLAWQSRGQYLAACATGKPVCVWERSTGKKIAFLDGGDVTSVSWGPGGKMLATAGWSGRIQIWNTIKGTSTQSLTGVGRLIFLHRVAWSPDGKTVALSDHNLVRLYEAATGKFLRNLRTGRHPITALAWSPDGKVIAAAKDEEYRVRLWSAETGKPLSAPMMGHTNLVTCLAFSKDSNYLASGGRDRTVRLWDVKKGVFLRSLTGHTGEVMDLAFRPDGSTLATAGGEQDHTVRLWDVQSGIAKQSGKHDGAVYRVAWSPDGSRLASGGKDHQVRLWNAETCKLLRTLDGPRFAVRAVAWLEEGRTIACLDNNRRLLRWDAATGEPRETTVGLTRFGEFSPDGRCVSAGVTSIWYYALRFFDASSGQIGGTLVMPRPGQSLVVSPDGHYRGTPDIEGEIVYVVQTEEGQETLRPEAFAKRYGWKNDPESVRLVPGKP